MPDHRGLSIVGHVVASFGALFRAFEIERKWSSKERRWFTWPFFPPIVGLIVEANKLNLYIAMIASIVYPGRAPRMVVSKLLFHVSNIIRLIKEKKK